MSRARPRFSRDAVRGGARASLPLMLGLTPFGLICGIVAQGQGLTLAETTLMSAAVYAGSAQLLVLGQWANPAPVLAAVLAAFAVNLRYVLMGPVLAPWLDRLRGWRLWGSLFLMNDQNWAMSVARMQAGRSDAGFLFGSGLAMWAVWVLTTMVGHAVGAVVQPPPGHPLFFAALAVFVALLASMWRGRADLLPWVVAAAVSVGLARLLPGTSWYIAGGALAGCAAGAWRDRARA